MSKVVASPPRSPTKSKSSEYLIHVVSSILGCICDNAERTHPKAKDYVTKFHAATKPSISLHDYLDRIHTYAECSDTCFILALVYMDRVQRKNVKFTVTSLNIHRLLITSVMMAAKWFDDQYFNNSFYARIGGICLPELNQLELDFLFIIGFSLHVTDTEYYQYDQEVKFHANSVFANRAIDQPLSSTQQQQQYNSSNGYPSPPLHSSSQQPAHQLVQQQQQQQQQHDVFRQHYEEEEEEEEEEEDDDNDMHVEVDWSEAKSGGRREEEDLMFHSDPVDDDDGTLDFACGAAPSDGAWGGDPVQQFAEHLMMRQQLPTHAHAPSTWPPVNMENGELKPLPHNGAWPQPSSVRSSYAVHVPTYMQSTFAYGD